MPEVYFVGGAGLALGAGEGDAAGAGVALPAVAGAAGAGLAAAAAWGWAPGLIQQTWMRLSRVSATLGSICPPKRVRQRKAAWTWPPGWPGGRSMQTRQPIQSGGPGRQRRSASKPQLLDHAPVDAYIPRLVSGRGRPGVMGWLVAAQIRPQYGGDIRRFT